MQDKGQKYNTEEPARCDADGKKVEGKHYFFLSIIKNIYNLFSWQRSASRSYSGLRSVIITYITYESNHHHLHSIIKKITLIANIIFHKITSGLQEKRIDERDRIEVSETCLLMYVEFCTCTDTHATLSLWNVVYLSTLHEASDFKGFLLNLPAQNMKLYTLFQYTHQQKLHVGMNFHESVHQIYYRNEINGSYRYIYNMMDCYYSNKECYLQWLNKNKGKGIAG